MVQMVLAHIGIGSEVPPVLHYLPEGMLMMYKKMKEKHTKKATELLRQADGYFESEIESHFKDFFLKEPKQAPECTWIDETNICEYKGGMLGVLRKHPNLCSLFSVSDIMSLNAATWAYHFCQKSRSLKAVDKAVDKKGEIKII
jgi:hypothetical protein